MSNYIQENLKSRKGEFIATAKWACKYAGIKVVFDTPTGKPPSADVDNKIIHMPKQISVDEIPMHIGILIHESMHIKHTPKWLNTVVRDSADKLIINAFEDERIERIACKQLRAFKSILREMTCKCTQCTGTEQRAAHQGMLVLANVASSNCGYVPFYTCSRLQREASKLISDMKEVHTLVIERVTPTSFRTHLKNYYSILDKLKLKLDIKSDKDEQQQQKQQQNNGQGDSPKEQSSVSPKCEDGSPSEQSKSDKKLGNIALSILNGDEKGSQPGNGVSHGIDFEDTPSLTSLSIDLDLTVRDRIKQALLKSVTTSRIDGNKIDTDKLTSFLTNDCDELFYERKKDKQVRTKVYFMLDVSGSMSEKDMQSFNVMGESKIEHRRLDVSISAFTEIKKVIEELKSESGCDLDCETFVFADRCTRWDMEKGSVIPNVGGGSSFSPAIKKITEEMLTDDPANKRILVVITDGEFDFDDLRKTERLLSELAQDIRVVIIKICSLNFDRDRKSDMFKHRIHNESSANTATFEAFEEAI